MSEELESVDTSTIEDLQKLREQVEVLQGRLASMEERKDSVSDAVYQRVAIDYQTQLDELAEEAAPLKARAREEYARLRVIYEDLEKAQSEARLAKEEIEFRRELGEFEDKEFESLSKEHAKSVADCEKELAAAGVVRQSFIDAFGSEEDLERPTESTEEVEVTPEPRHEDAEAPSDSASDAEESADEDDGDADGDGKEGEAAEGEDDDDDAEGTEDPAGTMAIPAGGGIPLDRPITDITAITEAPSPSSQDASVGGDQDAEDTEEADGAEDSDDGTSDSDWSTAATNVFESPLVPDPSPPFAPSAGIVPPAVQSDATRILPKPRLISLEGGEPVSTYVLGPTVVTLGRATDNSIRLTEEAVSRHHAEVIPGPDGFLLRDQGSENGTYINGKRKKEHLLVEGDIIQIGVKKLRFHDA